MKPSGGRRRARRADGWGWSGTGPRGERASECGVRVRRRAELRNGWPGTGESRGRASGLCGFAGAARIFPVAAAGKLIPGRKRWRDGPTGRGRAAGVGVFCGSLSALLPVPDPGPVLLLQAGSPLHCGPPASPFVRAGAASGRRRERWGHGEGCAGPAGVQWGCSGLRVTRPGPRGAAAGRIRLHPGRGPLRASLSRCGAAPSFRAGGHAAAAALPFSRMVLGEETRARTPRVSGRAARLGAPGSGARAASLARSLQTRTSRPKRRETHVLVSDPCSPGTQATSPAMAYFSPLFDGRELGTFLVALLG